MLPARRSPRAPAAASPAQHKGSAVRPPRATAPAQSAACCSGAAPRPAAGGVRGLPWCRGGGRGHRWQRGRHGPNQPRCPCAGLNGGSVCAPWFWGVCCPQGCLLCAPPARRCCAMAGCVLGTTVSPSWCPHQGGSCCLPSLAPGPRGTRRVPCGAVVAAPGTLSSWRCLETSPLPAGARQTWVTQHGPRGHRQLPQQGRAPAPAAHPGSTHGRPQPLGTDPCRGCATSPQLVAFPVAGGKALAGLGHGVCVPKSRAGHGALKESGSPASPSHHHGAISGPE